MKHVLTILAVDALDAMAAFYGEGLGLREVVRVPVYVELVDPEGQRLGLYQRGGFVTQTEAAVAPPPAQGTTATELYFHDPDPPGVVEALCAAGATLLSALAVRPWGDEAAYLRDPEGNVVVVARPVHGGA